MPTSPISTPHRTVRGRTVLGICAVLIIALAGTAGWYMVWAKPKAGPYIDTLALDGHSVVALRDEVTEGRAFVELIDISAGEAGLRWQALVPHYRAPEGAVGVAANDNVVTVRFLRDGGTQAFGFATDSARKLGTIILGEDLPREDDGAAAPNIATLSGGTMSFEILAPDGRPDRVYGVSLLDGNIAWDADLPVAGIDAAWVTTAHLVIEQPGQVTVLDRAGTATSRAASAACVIPGDTRIDDVLITGGDASADLLDLGKDGITVRRHVTWSDPAMRFTGACARAGDDLLLAVERPDPSGPWTGVERVPGDGGAVRYLDVAAGSIRSDAFLRGRVNAPTALPFSGPLGPTAVMFLTTSNGSYLVGWDHKSGRIVWQTPPSHALDDAVVVDTGTAVLLRAGDVIASIDPRTGAARAVRAPGTRPLRAHNVAQGVLWVTGDRGLAALDAITLTSRGTWHDAPAITPATADDLAPLGLQLSQ